MEDFEAKEAENKMNTMDPKEQRMLNIPRSETPKGIGIRALKNEGVQRTSG